jgi:transcriptional regulator with XRE-family HTH domain
MAAEAEAGPTEPVEVKKRRLRGALREARKEAAMTQKAAADQLVWSQSKIVRIEQGTVPVTPTDVRVMMQLYHADAQRVEAMVELAKHAREDKGWADLSDILSQASLELFGNEPAAKVIYKYEPSVVPGLFQTEEYARSLLKALGISEAEIEKRLEVRLRRQQMLEDSVRPELNFILGEAALIRPVGGEQVMKEQIAHIQDLAKLNDINVWLLPFSAGPHRGMGSAFTVLQFTDENLRDLLYLENAERESVSRDEKKDIRKYLDLYVDLRAMAENSGEPEDLIDGILRERYGVSNSAK